MSKLFINIMCNSLPAKQFFAAFCCHYLILHLFTPQTISYFIRSDWDFQWFLNGIYLLYYGNLGNLG